MEYNITLKGYSGKWKRLHTTEADCLVVVSEIDEVKLVGKSIVSYDEVLTNFTVEAYITIKAVSVEAAVDRVRNDLDKFEYVGVSLGYL